MMMSLEDPQAERGKKENETTQKRGCYEEDKMCSISAGWDDGGGEDGYSELQSESEGNKDRGGSWSQRGRRHGNKETRRNKEAGIEANKC